MSDRKTHGLAIGTMNIESRWPWTVLVQGHYNFTSSISKYEWCNNSL